MRYLMPLLLIAVAACGREGGNAANAITDAGEPAVNASSTVNAENAAAPATIEQDAYLGKWTGPEGLVLDVTEKAGGGVAITNQWTLDDKGSFDGSVTAEGLRFMRDGEAVTAVRSDGDATGMKWLAGKTDCLTVKPGSEGYCRD